eukprot:XP_003726258.1 PREDICTED: uncharacterized protein LOC100893170 [Strongylocentrotus purpuratus]
MADYGAGRQQEQDKIFECSECKLRYSFRTNLCRHRRTIHKKETKRERTTCTFPGCSMKFYHQTKLLSHLQLAHGQNTEKTDLTFPSIDKFLSWKEREEAENFLCFTKQGGGLNYHSVIHQHYICQRDGKSRRHLSKSYPGPKTNRTLRRGVVKTDLVCPARMLVRQCKKDGRVNVSYYKSHSHPISPDDVVHHPLPDSVRKDIKNKLASGMTANQIYQQFQDQSCGRLPSSTMHDIRLKHINKPQIRAIHQRLQRNPKEVVQSQSDPAYNVVVEVLHIADTCNTSNGRESPDINVQASEQQNIPLDVNTKSGNIKQELLFSKPVANPLCEATVPFDYGPRLHGILSEILVLMENENVRKTMLPCVIEDLEGMLSLCQQEANSHNVRHGEVR